VGIGVFRALGPAPPSYLSARLVYAHGAGTGIKQAMLGAAVARAATAVDFNNAERDASAAHQPVRIAARPQPASWSLKSNISPESTAIYSAGNLLSICRL
jgi:hypothetical protein